MIAVLIVGLALMIPVLAILLDSQLGRALAARIERGGPDPDSKVLSARVRELEAELEQLSDEVARLGDESRFMTRLLAERSGAEPLSSGDPAGGLKDPGSPAHDRERGTGGA
jgi:hypothetical protein